MKEEHDKFKELLYELQESIRTKLLEEFTAEDIAVMKQKTVFYKFYCWFVYRHLYKDGVCLRCGKILKSK